MSSATVEGLAVSEPVVGVLLVELDRAARHNALSTEMLTGLDTLVARTNARGIVVAGRGSSFCAGYDLREAGGNGYDAEGAEQLIAHPRHRLFTTLAEAPVPVVAAMHGATLGGGLELACACDVRVAAADARFGIPAGVLGLVYSASGLERVGRVFGLSAVREMVLTARRLDARRAEALGAVAEVIESPLLVVERAIAIATQAAELAPGALSANKRILGALGARPLATMHDREVEALDALRVASFAPGGELQAGVERFLTQSNRERA
jgi:enoyl-CoA hydratase/carnithine racemase